MRRVASVIVVGFLLLASCKKEPSATPVTTKCKADADCTWAWTGRGECCVNPCGGGMPVHLDENAAIGEYNASYCTEARRKACPQAGACSHAREPAPTVKCDAGACVAVRP